MATLLQNLSKYNADTVPDGYDMKIGIVVADWNANITHSLLKGAIQTLIKHQVSETNIVVHHVPGTFELPLAAQLVLESNRVDAVITLGCVITGETRHDEYINSATAKAIMQLGLSYNLPVIFGVLTPQTLQQALDRAGGKHGNKGVEAAVTALKMVHLKNVTLGENPPIL